MMNVSDIPQTESTAPVAINVWSGALGDPAAAVVNEYSVLSIPSFWSGVRFLSETLASLPKAIYRRQGDARQRVDNHPQTKILSRKANQYATPFVVFETWHSHAIIHGNGYLFVARDPRTSAPTGYFNVNPLAVTPFRYDGAQWYLVRAGMREDGKPKNLILPAADVLHLPGLGFDGMIGYPIVWLMYEALELARNSQRFASRYLKRGTQVQGAIEIPGSATKEQIEVIVDRLRRAHSGLDNDYSYTVLTGGAKLNNATIPPEQSQLLESRQFAVIDMCRILRVPPHVVYDLGRATWSNVESMGLEAVRYSLRSWVEKAEQELSSKLLTEAEQDQGLYVRYSVDALLRGDTKTQTSNVLSLVNGGVITANEGRGMLDLAPLDDPSATKLRVPVNFPVPEADTKPADNPSDEPSKSDPPAAPAAGANEFAKFQPVIDDAINRVETKTALTFTKRENMRDPERTIWANVFAEEQGRYIADALRPVAQVIEGATGAKLDLDTISQRYAASIRGRAAGAAFKTLQQIIADVKGATDVQAE